MQLLIVILILVATVALTVRWVVRTAKGKGGCGCSGCPNGGGKECHCCDKGPTLPEINVDE